MSIMGMQSLWRKTMRCGRPGLNPLRFETVYHVTQEYYDQVAGLAALTKVNASMENSVKNGYKNPPPEGTFLFGKYKFKLDETNWIESIPNETDMARIEGEIREAGKQADVVLVSIHAHETDAGDTKVPAMFLETFARRCVDAGADVIIGHGPHELRGIEIYKGKPIFYSLGNFLFETETVDLQPYDAYLNKKLPVDGLGTAVDGQDARIFFFCIGWIKAHRRDHETVQLQPLMGKGKMTDGADLLFL